MPVYAIRSPVSLRLVGELKTQRDHTVNRMSSSLPEGGHSDKYHLDTQKVKTVQKQTPKQANTENQIRSTERSVIYNIPRGLNRFNRCPT